MSKGENYVMRHFCNLMHIVLSLPMTGPTLEIVNKQSKTKQNQKKETTTTTTKKQSKKKNKTKTQPLPQKQNKQINKTLTWKQRLFLSR